MEVVARSDSLTLRDVASRIRRAIEEVRQLIDEIGLDLTVTCHSFRASGITAYLDNGGTIENAQQLAAHESARTTKLHDKTSDQITLDEIEKIVF